MLNIYSFFHLNLCFSSIEEERHPEVIERCYWPLLNMASKHKVPIGIEASGYTLERINILCPDWIENLKELIKKKLVSFVGCGYAQIIGPIVPYEVNKKNLEIYRCRCELWFNFNSNWPKMGSISF